MPTYTLLGEEVVRLPSSLRPPWAVRSSTSGSEIWFYIDYAKGNWAEGLTTYLADQLYEERKGRGVEYRKGALIDYQSYVNDRNEFPLGISGSGKDNAFEGNRLWQVPHGLPGPQGHSGRSVLLSIPEIFHG